MSFFNVFKQYTFNDILIIFFIELGTVTLMLIYAF